jgi:hypothetical protein
MNRLCGRMGRAAVRLRVIMHSYKKKGGQPCRPPLFFVSFVIFVIFVLIVLIDDQCRTAIERQGRLL